MNETPKEAARRLAASAIRKGYKFKAVYAYKDANGTVLYWRIRCKHRDGRKWIRPMRRNGKGYELGEPEFTEGKPLYRLPDIAKRPEDRIWFLEGEPCVGALARRGLLATTSGSADSARHADLTPLSNRRVIIWPDNDEAGLRHAQEVADKLVALGATVRMVEVGKLNLPHKGDVVDWLKAHPNATAVHLEALPMTDYVKAESTGAGAYTWPPPQPLVVPSQAAQYPLDALPGSIGAAVQKWWILFNVRSHWPLVLRSRPYL